MLRIVVCLSVFFFSLAAHAQQDSANIQTALSAKGGYVLLSKRFIDSDTTLSIADFKLIYYGFQFEKAYRPLETEFSENLIKPYNRAGRYTDAIHIADSILLKDPVSITAHFEKSFACAQSNLHALESYHRKRYIVLCNVIKSSGNGSKEKPFYVLSVNDALEAIAYLGLQATNDRQTESGIIEFDLAKNKSKLVHIYFSIPTKAYSTPDNHDPDSE